MKDRYALDYSNRLVIKRRRQKLVADGRFSVDKKNQLVYFLNEPSSWRRRFGLPNKIAFEGKWRLGPNHDLELILNKTKDQYEGGRLLLRGEIISPDRDSLVFQTKCLDKAGLLHLEILKLSGAWQADEYNRITFLVEKKTLPDIIILEGAWQLNRNQQITYTYEKTVLKTKTKIPCSLTFEGFWRIDSATRITYILEHSSISGFCFRAQLESPNLYPKEGVIKYRLGAGLKEGKVNKPKSISLYGNWRFSRSLGLVFCMEYAKGRIHSIEFGSEVDFNRKNQVIFKISSVSGQGLGVSVVFTHRFLKQLDAEAFLRLRRYQQERGVDIGLRIPF